MVQRRERAGESQLHAVEWYVYRRGGFFKWWQWTCRSVRSVEGLDMALGRNSKNILYPTLLVQNRSCRLYAHYDSLRFSSSICSSSFAIRTRYTSLSLFNRDRYSSCATRWKPIDLNKSCVQDSEGRVSVVGIVWFGVCLETYFTRCTLNSFPISWRVAQKRAEVTAPGSARRYLTS